MKKADEGTGKQQGNERPLGLRGCLIPGQKSSGFLKG